MAIEIERTFLLRTMPVLPPGARAHRIRQGYLPDPDPDAADAAGSTTGTGDAPVTEGRVRHATAPDGTVRCTHTIKRGAGLRRTEIEREIAPEAFEELWPRTSGRRIVKTRHVVALADGSGLAWEIDRFENLDLVLAEIELPTEDTPVVLPPWLAPHVVREVTDEPAYRNFALALRARPGAGDDPAVVRTGR